MTNKTEGAMALLMLVFALAAGSSITISLECLDLEHFDTAVNRSTRLMAGGRNIAGWGSRANFWSVTIPELRGYNEVLLMSSGDYVEIRGIVLKVTHDTPAKFAKSGYWVDIVEFHYVPLKAGCWVERRLVIIGLRKLVPQTKFKFRE